MREEVADNFPSRLEVTNCGTLHTRKHHGVGFKKEKHKAARERTLPRGQMTRDRNEADEDPQQGLSS